MYFILSYVLYKLCLNVPIAFVLSFLISQIMAFAMSTKYTIYISRPPPNYGITDLFKTD